ncbi:hypothetical protein D3C81_1960060 [compost metagenome]
MLHFAALDDSLALTAKGIDDLLIPPRQQKFGGLWSLPLRDDVQSFRNHVRDLPDGDAILLNANSSEQTQSDRSI